MKKLICIIMAMLFVFGFSACSGSNAETENKTYAPATVMDLNTIFADFYNNEMKAKETHEGQRYRITATATDITENSVTVTEDIKHPYSVGSFRITLYFDESQIDFIKSLSRGNTVTFEGTLTDLQDGNWMDFEEVVFIGKSE